MAEEIAELMDNLGYYAFWGAEHHFQREGYECFPNLILLSTHLAGRTQHLKFGCGFNIAPLWHPIRLAEDYAMADVLTRGRVIFGIGRGYQTREVESLGAPLLDREANRELFEEQVEIILKAFNEESFSHHGKHYTIPAPVEFRGYDLKDITVVPRPVHRPVEIWQPVSSGRSIEFMAKHGINAMLSLNGEQLTEQIMQAYQAQCARYGRELELGQNTCLGMGFCIDDTQEKAM
jgi:alkanesulfonate monooxygenase SsuD/methylene tetrahydromethanopterin reductase-like flavin-dependent oxidoreductase (luciferase family)